jgi:bacterial/archaeal transporter family-2 protein
MLITLVAGALTGMQGPINAALGKKIGGIEGALFSFSVGTLLLLLLLPFFGKGSYRALTETQPWQWIGGAFGIVFVTTMISAVPKLGSSTAIMAAIAGQLLIGAMIDQFGWFGLTQTTFSWTRLLGILLMGVAIFLVKK